MKWHALLLGVVVGFLASARGQQLSITPSSATYSASGGTITFSVRIEYSAPQATMGLEITAMPERWTFVATEGANRPSVAPMAGAANNIEFGYTTIPASPVTFTFTVAYPAGLSGAQTFSGIRGLFRPEGGSLQIVTLSDIVLTAVGGPVTPPPPPPPGPSAPAIVRQPTPANVVAGQQVTLSVEASGTAPLSYQWRKDNITLAGATAAILVLQNTTTASSGTYAVTIQNSAGLITSTPVLVTVTPPAGTAPAIATQPVSQSIELGRPASLSVAATGTAPLAYQWWKNGSVLTGRTQAALAFAAVQSTDAGSYSVTVTNTFGAATSAPATLQVSGEPTPPSPPPPGSVAGAFFGRFEGDIGTLALWVKSSGTAVLLAHLPGQQLAFVARDVPIDASRRFRAVVRPIAGAQSEHIVEGRFGADGVLSGTVSGVTAGFTAPAAAQQGATANIAGFYELRVAGSFAQAFAIAGAAGEIYWLGLREEGADSGGGALDARGVFELTTVNTIRTSGIIPNQLGAISATASGADGKPVLFTGANPDARANIEKLVNISSRSRTGAANATLIAGFVISGDRPKRILARAIGPSLAGFGVAGALPAARLEIYRGETAIATGGDWAATGDSFAIEAAAGKVGAFALTPGSRDAAILINLEPGGYSAVVSGQAGEAGLSLLEIYDATEGDIPRTQRIINISTRAVAAADSEALIAGFVIDGALPKRVLVRGVGPTLAEFGVSGSLPSPRLSIYSGATLIAENLRWNRAGNASALAEAFRQAGAFPLGTDAADAAIVLNLSPGSYTAHVTGENGASGVALIEVYELP